MLLTGPGEMWAELGRRFDAVEPLEVRLDITTLWCFALARELFYVPPGGRQVAGPRNTGSCDWPRHCI